MRIQDGKNSDPESGMVKIRIQDKHPGSPTPDIHLKILIAKAPVFRAVAAYLRAQLRRRLLQPGQRAQEEGPRPGVGVLQHGAQQPRLRAQRQSNIPEAI